MALQPSAPAHRLVDLVEFLAQHQGAELRPSEIARGAGLNRTTCTALLLALEARGWVHSRSGRYSLGAALIPLAEAALANLRIADEVQPELDALVADLGMEALASVVSGRQLVVVAHAHARAHAVLSGTVRVGQTIPFVPPFGIAHLVHAEPERIDSWLDQARLRLDEHERAEFRAVIGVAEQRGYVLVLDLDSRRRFEAVMIELAQRPHSRAAQAERAELLATMLKEEQALGPWTGSESAEVSQISAPVFGADGRPVLAMGVHGLPHQIEPAHLSAYAARVTAAAARVTERVHGVAPPGVRRRATREG